MVTREPTIRTSQRRHHSFGTCALIILTIGLTNSLYSFQTDQAPLTTTSKGSKEMQTVRGEFEVKMIPVESGNSTPGEFRLDKSYQGPLTAAGQGKMLTGMTDVKNSAAYVAIEQIDGTLDGKKGSFLICHCGFMNRGEKELQIRIVPDSGKGELAGIQGTMGIDIRDGKHFYELVYSLDSKP